MYLLSEFTEMGPKKTQRSPNEKRRSPPEDEVHVVKAKVPKKECRESASNTRSSEPTTENGEEPNHLPTPERLPRNTENVSATHQPTSGKDLQQMIAESQMNREKIKRKWKCLKKYTSPDELLKALCQKGLLSSENFGNLREMDMSLAHDLVLTESFYRIHNEISFRKFIDAVALVCPDVDFEWEKYPIKDEHSDNKAGMYSRLERNRKLLKRVLKPDVVNDIKDELLQQSIIDIHEHEAIACDARKNSSDKFIETLFGKILEGSDRCFNCLLKRLQHIANEKQYGSQSIRSLLHALDETPGEQERVPRENGNRISIKMIEGKPYQQLDEYAGDIISRLKIYSENPQSTDQIIQEYATGMSTSSVQTFACYVDRTDNGSVVICFKTLDDDMKFRLKKSLIDGSFLELLENMFNEDAIRTSFSKGKYTLEIIIETDRKCEPCEDKLGKGSATLLNMDKPKNIITANRSFLIQQIDTGSILESFSERYVSYYEEFLKAGVVFEKEREKKAEMLLSVIERHNLEEVLLQILKYERMTYVVKRLERCQQVYSHTKDVNRIRKNIIRRFRVLVEALDIDDLWETFAERGFNNKLFYELEEKFRDKRDQSTAALLIEILKCGCSAILTLIDCLFCNHMDSLADDLLTNSYSLVAEDVDDGCLSLASNKGTKKGLLFEGTFEIKVETEHGDNITDRFEKGEMLTDATFQSLEIKQRELKFEQELQDYGDNITDRFEKGEKLTDATYQSLEIKQRELKFEQELQDKEYKMNEEEKKFCKYGTIVLVCGKEAVSMLLDCQLTRKNINFLKRVSDKCQDQFYTMTPHKFCHCNDCWRLSLFDIAKPKLPGHEQSSEQSIVCCSPVDLKCTAETVDFELLVFLVMNVKELNKCPNDILEAVMTIHRCREEINKYLDTEKFPHENILGCESDIKNAILLICRYCETETKMKRKMEDVDMIPADRSSLLQYRDRIVRVEEIKVKTQVKERKTTLFRPRMFRVSTTEKSKLHLDPKETIQGIKPFTRRMAHRKKTYRKRFYYTKTNVKGKMENLKKSRIYIKDDLLEYI